MSSKLRLFILIFLSYSLNYTTYICFFHTFLSFFNIIYVCLPSLISMTVFIMLLSCDLLFNHYLRTTANSMLTFTVGYYIFTPYKTNHTFFNNLWYTSFCLLVCQEIKEFRMFDSRMSVTIRMTLFHPHKKGNETPMKLVLCDPAQTK